MRREALFAVMAAALKLPITPAERAAILNMPDVKAASIRTLPAFVVTQRVLRVWEQVLLALHVRNEHVLIVGDVGCGKTEALRALACLLQEPLHHV